MQVGQNSPNFRAISAPVGTMGSVNMASKPCRVRGQDDGSMLFIASQFSQSSLTHTAEGRHCVSKSHKTQH